MIAFLSGKFVNIQPAKVYIEVHGVGYEAHISLQTYAKIVNKESGTLYIHLQITENAHTLYGFASIEEKELFLHLISVSGVGPASARIMLSGLQSEEITRAIVEKNTKLLETIKGIGKKSAERLVVELKDKLSKNIIEGELSIHLSDGRGDNKQNIREAIEALIALGINRQQAEHAVTKASMEIEAATTVQELIKLSLKSI